MVLNNLTMAWITVSHISILQATCGSHYLKIVMFDISIFRCMEVEVKFWDKIEWFKYAFGCMWIEYWLVSLEILIGMCDTSTDVLNSQSPLVNLPRGGHFPHATSHYPQPGPIFVPALSYIAPQPQVHHQLCSLGYPGTMDINYFNLYQSYSTVANNTLQSFQHYSCDSSDCRSLPCGGYSIQAEETTVNRCLRHGFSYSPVQVDASVPDGSSSTDVCEKSKCKLHILFPVFNLCWPECPVGVGQC